MTVTIEGGVMTCTLITGASGGIGMEPAKITGGIRDQSLDERYMESLANHDPDVMPHTILL